MNDVLKSTQSHLNSSSDVFEINKHILMPKTESVSLKTIYTEFALFG